MFRIALIAGALLAGGSAAAKGQMSDYVRGINEERCAKQDAAACGELINAGFGTPNATLARALAVRGAARLRANNLAGAKADLTRALEVTAAPQDATMAKLDSLRGVRAITPAWRGGVSANLARVLIASGDKAGAGAAVTTALKLDPGNAAALTVRARLAGAERRWAAALADFNQALEIGLADPGDRAMTLYHRSVVRTALKQPAPAVLADLNAAIAADPGFTYSYEGRGEVYESLGRYDEALRDFDTLVAKAPNYADGYNAACWVRAAYVKREFDKARALCDRALALAPEANFYDSAGLVALQQGRWQDAWTLYDKAVKGEAKMASARYGRGIAAMRLGRTAEAKTDIAAATTMDAGVAAKFAGYGHKP